MASIVAVFCLSLVALPIVYASCDTSSMGCQHTIKVIPVGAVETGDPIVTGSPAELMIFHTGSGPIENVWLLIVLDKVTYDALEKITIDGATFMTKADFALVTAKKIPPTLANPTTGYPGSECQYEVSAVKDKLDEEGASVYYGVKFFLNQITKIPTHFTLAVDLDSTASGLKALILALGRYSRFSTSSEIDCRRAEPFNVCSAFSKSTLVVPEAATVALSAAPFGALGLRYVIRRKK